MTKTKPMVKAGANIKKNRLYITISGNIDAESLEKLFSYVQCCVADLRAGFEVISDISACNLLYINSFSVYKKIIDYLIANNAGETVRIVRNNNISSKQIINFYNKIQTIKPVLAESVADAEIKLEQGMKRDAVRFQLKNLSVQYAFNDTPGQGTIVNISASGCAVEPLSPVTFTADSIIDLDIIFADHDELIIDFRVKGRVVRVTDQQFAVQFLDLDEKKKKRLYERLAYEVSLVHFVP
ncbi:PilZ domain-containing protein [Desulfobulbus oligotrophicus]|jgi:hypothetical protein|uniref:PilZ domain-containing protein n=1 Tax=Desulfobulbus oligotrophicus TaxID=1909699 RepID=A0A7T6ARC6_9BACT|nr:PilZ domain-containing protein [Desulfobulbus oligotrophicus]MDY0391745.1 PilZ domain-containing protein [Desulfobulbus oligotrophicus]QQG66412.1 PilZ domain-containing protein [Desulfobulbus oligotrophicus]